MGGGCSGGGGRKSIQLEGATEQCFRAISTDSRVEHTRIVEQAEGLVGRVLPVLYGMAKGFG